MAKKKFEVKFDPEKRKEFLTGFKKRKDERRKYGEEMKKKDITKAKEEFRISKKKAKASIDE